jgi:hypothetical protein
MCLQHLLQVADENVGKKFAVDDFSCARSNHD